MNTYLNYRGKGTERILQKLPSHCGKVGCRIWLAAVHNEGSRSAAGGQLSKLHPPSWELGWGIFAEAEQVYFLDISWLGITFAFFWKSL